MSSVRILFLAANPRVTTRLALDQECAAIERELRLVVHRDFEFTSRWAVTVDELMRHLNELQPTVVHFSGHGRAGEAVPVDPTRALRDAVVAGDRDHDRDGIYLHDEHDQVQLVTSDALTRMVKAASSSARLVVLNACFTEAQAELMCSAVDCVVGMAGAIDDDSARAFAVAFYRALGNRRSVGNAVEQAIATLAGKRLPGTHLPCCRCRDGLSPGRVYLSKPVNDPPWQQRFDAVVRLCREAHDNVESDPWSAAQRARSAIEHIVDYLYEREIGPTDPDDTLRVRLGRVEAKLVIPPMVADHVDFVQSHTSSVIRVGGMAEVPEPGLLQPCLGSLSVVVKWFFREYLKQAAPDIGSDLAMWRSAERLPVPDLTPINSTSGTSMNTQFGTGIGEFMPIWRSQPNSSVLRIEAESDPNEHRAFKIEDQDRSYTLGRTERRRDGTRNDFVLPKTWSSISRDQATIGMKEGGVLLTNSSSKNNVLVRREVVAHGAGRLLRHGDLVQIGRCVGAFSDGRYYAATPSAAIDWRTGLLSRIGLIAEISGFLATGAQRWLFVVRCPEGTAKASRAGARLASEQLSAAVAMAIHRHDPSSPVARIGIDVAVLLASQEAVTRVAAIADRVVGAPCVSGFMMLQGTADQASPRLEACLGALSRIAIAGRDAPGPKDLARYALKPTPLVAFADHAQPLFDSGGGAVLFALGDLPRLKQEAPQAVSVLELELVEMLGARMGPRDVVSFAGPGLLLFGTPGDVETFAHEVGVAWHARGPVTANAVEIDRCLFAHLLANSDLEDVAERAAALAQGESCALGATGLPAPLALAASAVDQTRDSVERARALVRLAEVSWKLLAFILVASARGADTRFSGKARASTSGDAAADAWPAPWRSVARDAAARLAGQPARLAELAAVALSADDDEAFRSAMEVIATTARLVAAPNLDAALIARGLPRLDHAVRKLFAALVPLRGWTLVSLADAEFDVDGISQRIDYVDYTGPNARGSQQRITVIGFRGLGRFSFLVRWNEGLAIALEPFVRRVRDAATGDHELCLASALVSEAGSHIYRSITGAHESRQMVTAKQLGTSVARRYADGVTER